MSNLRKKQKKPSWRVLIVEDDRGTNELIATALRLSGFQADQAFSGPEALRLAENAPPDLIILDMLMPGMDGWEVCRHLRREGAPTRNIPVVVASVVPRADLNQSQQAMGAIAFFNKPFEAKQLVQEIARLLGAEVP